MGHTMKAVDGKPIAERWAITYQLQRQVLRCFRGEPDEVVAAKRVMKLIEELSAAEERERVLREALEVMVGTVMLSDYSKRYEAFAKARAALATPAPEPSEQKADQ